MAAGEKTFSTAGVTPAKFENTPLKPAEYSGKLRTSDATIGKRPEPGKFPYVQYRIEVLDTAASEGGKNRQLFEMLFTSLVPSAKDGKLMPHRANQLVGLVRGLGAGDVDIPTLDGKDEQGKAIQYLSPTDLLKWLKSNDGAVVRFRSKVEKGTGNYGPSSKVDYFIEADSQPMTPGFGAEEEEGAPTPEASASEEDVEYVDENGNPVNADGTPITPKGVPPPRKVTKAASVKRK